MTEHQQVVVFSSLHAPVVASLLQNQQNNTFRSQHMYRQNVQKGIEFSFSSVAKLKREIVYHFRCKGAAQEVLIMSP